METKFEKQKDEKVYPDLEEYLNSLGLELYQYQDRPLYRLDDEACSYYLKVDDFLKRLSVTCIFFILVKEDDCERMREFLNRINSRISFACFYLNEERQICIRSERLITGAEPLVFLAEELLAGLNQDVGDFKAALEAVAAGTNSPEQALKMVMEQQAGKTEGEDGN